MKKFEIEWIKDVTEKDSVISKNEYAAKTDGFESVVVVKQFKEEHPFVGGHRCKVGGEHLWGFQFWNDLQLQVLEFHNERENENV